MTVAGLDDLYQRILGTIDKPDLSDWRPRDAYDHGIYDTLSWLWQRGLIERDVSANTPPDPTPMDCANPGHALSCDGSQQSCRTIWPERTADA